MIDLSNAKTKLDGTHIVDSCFVKSKGAMREYLKKVRESVTPEMNGEPITSFISFMSFAVALTMLTSN